MPSRALLRIHSRFDTMMLYVHDAQGQQRGPFDASTIVAMLQRGELNDRALCCAAGEAAWVAIRQHPAIVAELTAVAALSTGAVSEGGGGAWPSPSSGAGAWGASGGGSTWGSNSIPPSAGFAPASPSPSSRPHAHEINTPGGALQLGQPVGPASAATPVASQREPHSSSASAQRTSAATDEEAQEDAALGIPVEVVRPSSIVPPSPSTSAGAPGVAATGRGLEGARFVAASAASATTVEQVEARRVAREQQRKARARMIVGIMLGAGVLGLGGLAAVGWLRRSAAQDELARASAPIGHVISSELREGALVVELSLSAGTTAQDAIDSPVRCVREARSDAHADGAGMHRERLRCDVSAAPHGETQRLRLRLVSSHGTSEVLTTFARPPILEVRRDDATGASVIACRGARCSGTFNEREGLTLVVPARSTVRLGPTQRDAIAEGPLRVAVPWDELLASTPTRTVFERDGALPLELRVSVPGAPTLTARLMLSARALRAHLFRQWRPGQPLLLAGEVPSGAGRSTLVAEHGEVFGAPRTLRDVDLVVFYREGVETKVCRYVVAPRERRTMIVRREFASLSVYERRTARALGTKLFQAEFPRCPDVYSEGAGPTAALDHELVRAWLRRFVGP